MSSDPIKRRLLYMDLNSEQLWQHLISLYNLLY